MSMKLRDFTFRAIDVEANEFCFVLAATTEDAILAANFAPGGEYFVCFKINELYFFSLRSESETNSRLPVRTDSDRCTGFSSHAVF